MPRSRAAARRIPCQTSARSLITASRCSKTRLQSSGSAAILVPWWRFPPTGAPDSPRFGRVHQKRSGRSQRSAAPEPVRRSTCGLDVAPVPLDRRFLSAAVEARDRALDGRLFRSLSQECESSFT